MKKLLISLFLMFLCFGAYSQSIKRTSGSLAFLKTTKVIGVTFTYNNLSVGKLTEEEYVNKKMSEYNKQREGWGDEWKLAWIGDRKDKYEPKFLELFSKYIGEKGVTVGTSDCAYEMVVNTDFIELGFNVGVARKNASVSITCKFINKADGSEVGVVTVENSAANNFWGGDFDIGYRVQESFAKAGRELAEFMIKDAKL